MKISFLVTYYNQKEYVRKSLDSILSIDKPAEWEILVGDDGSFDGTIEIVRDYVNKYPDNIFLFVMSRDKNVKYDSVKRASENRINLLEHATGDCFCVLDGDDFYFDKSFVEDAIKVFNKNPEITVVGFGYKYYKNDEYSKDYILPAGVQGQVDKKAYLKSFYLPAGACVHKLCYGKNRIDYIKKIGYFDDNDIVINSLNYGEMYSISKAIYAYRQTGQSVYTCMSEIEQSVLNVQGMDVDLALSDEVLKEYIIARYSIDFAYMYICKEYLQSMLGEEKIRKYKLGCLTLHNSFCSALLNYSCLTAEKKAALRKLFLRICTFNFKSVFKLYIKYVLEDK